MIAGNTFSLDIDSSGAPPITLTVVAGTPAAAGEVQTVGDIINAINNAAVGATAFLGNEGELVIQRDTFMAGTEDIVLANGTGTARSPWLWRWRHLCHAVDGRLQNGTAADVRRSAPATSRPCNISRATRTTTPAAGGGQGDRPEQ